MLKSKRSVFNALFAAALSLFNGLLGFVLTRQIMMYFGSDFNGVNSTANQLVNMLSVVEGGFTTATNVALFKPVSAGDDAAINGIISATRQKFIRIGLVFLGAGLVVSGGYTFLAGSELPRLDIFLILVMAVLPLSVNFLFAIKYRILIQSEQKEYVISALSIASVSLGYAVNIVAVRLGAPMLAVRAITMIFGFAQSLFIIIYGRRKYKKFDFHAPADFDSIKGTRDVLAQKITGVIYTTTPMLLITAFSAGGAKQASVYSVYNYVFAMISLLMHALIDAPRLPIGQLASDRGVGNIKERFMQYELVIFGALSAMISTAAVMIMPFVDIYSEGVTDINYHDLFIGAGLAAAAFIDLAHIPATNLIVMSGDFRTSRRIQTAGSVTLVVLAAALCPFFDVYGIVAAVVVSAAVLAVLDLFTVHVRYYHDEKSFLRQNLPVIAVGLALIAAEIKLVPAPGGYLAFFVTTALVGVLNSAVIVSADLLLNRKNTVEVISTVWRLVRSFLPAKRGDEVV